MTRPIDSALGPLNPVGPSSSSSSTAAGGARPVEGRDFKSILLEGLEEVDRLQQQADAGVQQLATGETNDVAGVLAAVKKAEVAFSLLMEIRNKLLDAYVEIRQMRV